MDPSAQCRSILSVGCIYQELVNASNPSIVVSRASSADPQVCHATCSSVHPSAMHVGVRWDSAAHEMHCFCLQETDWSADMVGPEAACEVPCDPQGDSNV